MATQKTNDGNRNQQAVATQRGREQEGQQLQRRPRGTQELGRPSQINPLSMMRRMFDDLEMSSLGSPLSMFRGTSPFSMMRRMFDDMERMIDTMGIADQPEQRMLGLEWAPRIDVMRRDDRIVVHADLPGMKQDQIQISAQDNCLMIEGEREDVRESESGDVWQSERISGRFRRVIPMPEGADLASADARFENGVLEVSVRLPEASRARRIAIRGAGERQQGQHGQQNQPQQPSQQPSQQQSERH